MMLLVASVFAQDEEDLDADLLDMLQVQVVESASKVAQDVALAPGTIVVLTAEEMEQLDIHTLDEAINYLGVGMTVQPRHGSTTPHGDFGARGNLVGEDGGAHVLVTVNGHFMNEIWGGWQALDIGLGIPFEMIDHIEFVLGPGSVLYGTNAMLAVIDIKTKDPETWQGAHFGVRAGASMPIGRDGGIRAPGDGYAMAAPRRVSAGWAGVGEQESVLLAAEVYDQSGPDMHFGPQEPLWNLGDYTQPSDKWGGIARRGLGGGSGFIGLRAGDFELDVHGAVYDVRDPVSYEADFAHPVNLTRTTTLRGDMRYTVEASRTTTWFSRLYADTSQYAGEWAYPAGFCPGIDKGGRCRWFESDTSPWGGWEQRTTLDWQHDGRLTTLFGSDIRFRQVEQVTTLDDLERPNRPVVDLGGFLDRSIAGAVYAQQIWRPTDLVGLNVGARLDRDDKIELPRLSPRAAVSLLFDERNSMSLVYAEAFRAPGAGEVLYEDVPFQLQAVGLRAEGVRSLELASRNRLSGGWGLIQSGLFASQWTDLIAVEKVSRRTYQAAIADGRVPARRPRDRVEQYQNAGERLSGGGFVRAAVHDPDRVVRAGLAVSVTRTVEDGQPIPLLPPVIANGHVSWDLPGSAPRLTAMGLYYAPRGTLEGFQGNFVRPVQAPALVQLRLSATGELTEGLSFDIGTEHAFAKGGAGPYLVGQAKASDDPQFGGELASIEQLRAHLGLQADF